jgi:LysR family transcriptional regulator, hypochlorite-specific transcription factor HypT
LAALSHNPDKNVSLPNRVSQLEFKWIEDFLSLADTRSFSRSAQARHVTQPAFSRRIRALESWLGEELIDRTSYPTRLTPAGEQFREHAAGIIRGVFDARAALRGQHPIPVDTISFAAPHALSLNYFPKWISHIEAECFDHSPLSTRMDALNVHDAVMALVEGHCDVLMCYHHPEQPVQLDPRRYAMIALGMEAFGPYSKCDRARQALFSIPGTASKPVPYLAYSDNAFLGRMVEIIVSNARRQNHLRKRYEADMAEALKVMALEGQGVAWLPESSVTREVKRGQLVSIGDPIWHGELEIRVYKERNSAKPQLNRLWSFLEVEPIKLKRSAKRGGNPSSFGE